LIDDIGKYGSVEGLYGEVFLDELEPHIIIKGGMLQTNALVHVFFSLWTSPRPVRFNKKNIWRMVYTHC